MNSKNDVTSSVKPLRNFYMEHFQETPNAIGYHYVVEEYTTTSKRPGLATNNGSPHGTFAVSASHDEG
ncbi:hypothetical protein QLX08_009740 [Tetragonisca angustula]|uniref:Uncharacterized protein n=1 Tax=Tetragonisca angustula TaxID=166442 RepID=A0AAW0ZF34_9HYME